MGGAACERGSVTDRDWERLLARIHDGNCTPFLGAGAASGTLPLGGDVARRWASEEGTRSRTSATSRGSRSSSSVQRRPDVPEGEDLRRARAASAPPDFDAPGEPHAVLAELPIPVYMTTNYDDFMVAGAAARREAPAPRALPLERAPAPRRRASSIGRRVRADASTNPVVYHLHGTLDLPESIVLTEDDYLDFLVAVSRRRGRCCRPQIQGALASTSLLFLGYRLADSNFRVLHRGLVASSPPGLRRLSVTVQLPPRRLRHARAYLARYFNAMSVSVYWGDASEFARDAARAVGGVRRGRTVRA